ncbi:hypothetical protein Zm00014a_013978 [Zea mays]|jgi:hypothetical protein|uniref:Uncharacterized protein n=1 Tax=Zea mays TaxID=4577 RepID=A0A3L6EMC2_MAIZE|nr:hypothetical protein Zm00014a_013978 [Zea mays]
MQGSGPRGGTLQEFKRRESVWKRVTLLQSTTGADHLSPIPLAPNFEEVAPPVRGNRRKRHRAKRRRAVFEDAQAMRQQSPATVSTEELDAPTALEKISTEKDQPVKPMKSPSCVLEFLVEMT